MENRAVWIECNRFETPLVSRVFSAQDVLSAELAVTGLGYFRAYLNGQPVSDDWLVPAPTDYLWRDTEHFEYPIRDEMRYRVLYRRYDVTHLVRSGENTLSILLGNGWFRRVMRWIPEKFSFGSSLYARYALCLRTAQGEIWVCSDGSERYGPSPVVESEIYRGEVIDARVTPRMEAQVRPVTLKTRLQEQTCPPDRALRRLDPVASCPAKDGTIYDFGENVAGAVSARLSGPAGVEAVLSYAERLTPDGTDLDARSAGWDQQDRLIGGGEAVTLTPPFALHAFRYVKVTGTAKIQALWAQVIHTDVAEISEFECDSEALNWLYDAFKRTFLNNLHGGYPSDCPHRERLGYTGDGLLTAEAAMYCFDLAASYRKWIGDIFGGQGASGHIQHTAPFQGGGGGPAVWGGAAVMLPYQHARFYGQTDLIRTVFPGVARWVDYMRSRMEDGLIVREEEGGWCLGDWGSHTPAAIDPAYVNTAYFAYLLEYAAVLARKAGAQEDEARFLEYRRQARAAVQRRFFDTATGDYCGNVQFANVFALQIGLGDERTAAHLRAAVDGDGPMDVGIAAMDLLVCQLFAAGDADRALRAIERLTARMRADGATTMWEYPYKENISNDHPMFCAMVRSLFSQLLGIRLTQDGQILIEDGRLPSALTYARGSTVLRGQRVTVLLRRGADGEVTQTHAIEPVGTV